MRRRLVLAAVALLAAGCGSGTPPEVTFAAAGTSVAARPTQYCDLKLTDCSDDAAAPVQLAVPAGTPLQVNVPDGVAEAPWHVVFSYRNAGGEQVDARSPLFAAQAAARLHPDAARARRTGSSPRRCSSSARRRRSTRTPASSSSRSAAAGC